jgi:hypothetical protein
VKKENVARKMLKRHNQRLEKRRSFQEELFEMRKYRIEEKAQKITWRVT